MIFVYDDTVKVPDEIYASLGINRFGDLLYKKSRIRDHIFAAGKANGITDFIYLSNLQEVKHLEHRLAEENLVRKILYFPAHAFPLNFEEFGLFLKKIVYSACGISVQSKENLKKQAISLLPIHVFKSYWQALMEGASTISTLLEEHKTIYLTNENYFTYLTDYHSVMKFLSNHLDTRYFNSLSGDRFYLTKSSTNKNKMQQEHDYYHLLPEALKIFFARPFNYQEQGDHASYSMERFNIPDMAIQWAHSAIEEVDFSQFLEDFFYFINHRPKNPTSTEAQQEKVREHYWEKVLQRMEEFKKTSCYTAINQLLSANSIHNSIEDILSSYQSLYTKWVKHHRHEYTCISHGDPCFSNILYDKRTRQFKLIDPRGAAETKDLYMDPYYDVAKLSHSILGDYDYINMNLFEIMIDNELAPVLQIMPTKTQPHKTMFIKALSNNGFDYKLTRLFEASLFLSMLPLHIDAPKKVFGFVLQADKILRELL